MRQRIYDSLALFLWVAIKSRIVFQGLQRLGEKRQFAFRTSAAIFRNSGKTAPNAVAPASRLPREKYRSR
jgi:hypothetical protein